MLSLSRINLTAALRKLERQAAKAEKLAKVEQAKADSIRAKLEQIHKLMGVLGRATAAHHPRGSTSSFSH